MATRHSTRTQAAASRPAAPLHGATSIPPEGPEHFARDRAALAAALDPIITIDARGIIQSASDSVLRVLGWTPRELVGRNVSMLMPEPHHSAHDAYLAKYQHTGQTNILNRPRRFDARRKDGSLLPIELCVSRAQVPGGGPPLFVGIIRDMTAITAAERSRDEERLRSQQQLAEQTAALQQAHARLRMSDRMASIGTLAAGLGHDMNNVLLPVRARLNALKASSDAGNLPRADRKHVDEIQKSVAYLQQLADGLHFLALDPDTEEDARGGGGVTDLRQWWSQAGTLLSKAVPKHVRVTAVFPAGLPAVGVPAHGLTQAVLNLVVNAGEAIPGPSERKRRQGLVRICAEGTTDDGRGMVRLSVMDNGSGMTEEVQRRAFEMFFTTKPRGLGTGLGLALVRNVVERAGGRVEVTSDVGKGTTVVMHLPAASTGASLDGARVRRAVVSLHEGRAAALIRHLLESGGVRADAGDEPGDAEIWITDPEPARVALAKVWRRAQPRGQLVLFGRPAARNERAWAQVSPRTIAMTSDFEAVRAAVHAAMSAGRRDTQP